jgi:threonine/homoserine/homoserine lactone efflux protein
MNPELILSFIGASVMLTLMPGPDILFVLTESITKGHRTGVLVSLGLGTGILIHTLAAATGLSLIIRQSALAFSVLKYFGAAYLFYLAYQTTKEKKPAVGKLTYVNKRNEKPFPLIRKGFLMNISNPKVSLFFIAFLPQFVTPEGLNITWQLIILGFIFMVQAVIIFSSVALLSGKLTVYVNRSGFWNTTKRVKIGVLSFLGLTLAFSDK